MNIIILGVRIIEDSDNRGSDNRGCTVYDIGGVSSAKKARSGENPTLSLQSLRLHCVLCYSPALEDTHLRVIVGEPFLPCDQ